jgi:hypothetical protein
MKMRCRAWEMCRVTQCQHYEEHDEIPDDCQKEEFCLGVDGMAKCAKIVDSEPVVERKDGAA